MNSTNNPANPARDNTREALRIDRSSSAREPLSVDKIVRKALLNLEHAREIAIGQLPKPARDEVITTINHLADYVRLKQTPGTEKKYYADISPVKLVEDLLREPSTPYGRAS